MVRSSEGRSGSESLSVSAFPVASVGTSLSATATLRDADGHVLAGRKTSWTSRDTSVASVSASGIGSAHYSDGQATIVASCEGRGGSAALTGTPPPVYSVLVVLHSIRVTAGETPTRTRRPSTPGATHSPAET